MASLSDSARRLEATLLEGPLEVPWKDAGDVGRAAVENMAGLGTIGRQMVSTGVLHLSGEGVHGSTAKLDAIGEVLRHVQRLVTSLGAAHEGHKNLTGQFPAAITSRTGLRLIGSPWAGSLVLKFTPEMEPARELTPGGSAPLIDEPVDQLADLAVVEAIEMLEAVKSVGPDADGSGFLEAVSQRGPRVATALRDLARTLDVNDFDTDVAWRQPGRATVRATLTRADAHQITAIIVARELDAEPVVLDGALRTVSDLTALVVELASGELVSVRGTELPPAVVQRATIHSRVRIRANVRIERRPGGLDVQRYTALAMELLD